jgi:hypothetical protein
VSRRLLVAFLLLVLAGCGGGSHKGAPRPAPPSPGQTGQLTPAEYRAIVHEYRELKPLSDGNDDPGQLARGQRTCKALTRPDTHLIGLVQADCLNAIDFFVALRRIEHAGGECAGIACVRDRYLAFGAAIKQTADGAHALNEELARRDITGLCATSIGITDPQLRRYRAAEQFARSAADALTQGDSQGFERASDALTTALSAGGSGDALRGIERACRPRGAKPLPRVPRGDGINA